MELNYAQIAAKGFPEPIQRVYLLHGSDDALKREAMLRLTEPLLDTDFRDFDLDTREIAAGSAGEQDSADILASAGGVPMASSRRVVVVGSIQRLEKEQQESLAAGLDSLGPLSCLVLIAGAPVYEAGKIKGRAAVSQKLMGAVQKAGATVLCDAPSEADLRARAVALVKARGKTIDPKAVDLVVQRAEAVSADRGGSGKTGDVTVLANELEKLLAYAADQPTITADDARAVGMQDPQENIFALCDSIGRRDAARALGEAEKLLAADPKADAVAARAFVMIARHLRMLRGAKCLADSRVNAQNARNLPPHVQSLLSSEVIGLTQRQSFRLRDLQDQARRWTDHGLAEALSRVLASDMTMKGIKAPEILGASAPAYAEDPSSNLRLLAVALCGISEK